ncbi:MAG: bifunctional salicylyl-CoA 5-hydroxylase/oxidoreductase [Deltaproteobacteria bacterium]|nr:bifunctional salicylyl-CoA 5-hydroxylase/oxidoreductase [Nannocystaceae bacterium]
MKIAVIGGGPAGLYFALLLRKQAPEHEIVVVERNRGDDTFGWGVVFSDETLGNFLAADRATHERITAEFVHWDRIDTHVDGKVISSGGHGFSGVARRRLLNMLQERCVELGVELRFEREVPGPAAFPDADLVVAADGINSRTRDALADVFKPDVVPGRAKFIWLGTEKVFDAFKFFIAKLPTGIVQVHAYPFDRGHSTFIVETDEATWRAEGLDRMPVDDSVAWCERLFARELDGAKLLTNKSDWINFRRVRNATWHAGNVVLIGDAAHTAHFSIGSGTKLAMEDAIALVAAVRSHDRVPAALTAYQQSRWLDVAKLQRSAETSQAWFENLGRYRDAPSLELVMSMMTRSKRVTHGNLRVRDQGFIDGVDKWFAGYAGVQPEGPVPPPMFVPLQLRELVLDNRVVVSPMCQYTASEGMPDDWHLVHLGARAVGGAGLVMAEMTDVSRDARITPGCTGIWSDAQAIAWRRVTEFVHRHSRAKIGLQLGHAGRKASTRLMWEGMDLPLPEGNWPVMSASPIAYGPTNQVPRAMDRADMDATIADYVAATERAIAAGFDLLELHMAHGYLLASFISPLTNVRTDAYGGDIHARMRFPLEVLAAVRTAWPDERPLSVRISATDWAPGGITDEDTLVLARALKAGGVDVIDVSTGQTSPASKPVWGRMFQAPWSDLIRHEVGIPTITVGSVESWDHVNTLLASGRADLVALARPHLADPHFTLHAAAEQGWRGQPWPPQYGAGRPR